MVARGEQNFSKGMTTDYRVQPPGTAKKIENFELIQLDGTNYAIRTANGLTKSFSVNPNYEPVGWYKISNKFMIHSAYCGTGALTNGEIGYVTVDKATGVATYLPIYNHADLLHSQAHQIEGHIIPENEKIERAYWSDNDQPPRTLNYFSDRMTTYIASGSIVNGTQYMVVRDSVEYPVASGDFYGPNEALGTVFTGGGTAVYTAVGSPLVIEYVNVNLLEFSPTHNLGFIRFNKWIPGNLDSKAYMYCYRLGTADGYFTPFSYTTRPIHVGSPAPTTGTRDDYQAYEGHPVGTLTDMGIQITIEGIDTNYDRIQVAAIPCTDYEVTEDPVLVYDSGITGSSMDIDHSGSLELQTLLLEDIQKILTNIRKVKTLTAVNNIHFIGNITTQKDSAWAFPGATLECAEYLVPTSDLFVIADNGTTPTIRALIGHLWSQEAIANQVVYHGQWYKVFGVGTVTYNAIVYNPGDTFQGDVEFPTYTPSAGTVEARPIIRIQQYSGVYREIEITDDWLDNKGQLTPSLIRSNWRTETYRYGILLYHNNGNPTYVKYLGDKTMPAQSNNPADIDPDTGAPFNVEGQLGQQYIDSGITAKHFVFSNLGVRISGIDFQGLADDLGIALANLPDIYSGFAIVRCPRDEQIVAQGICFGTNADGNGDIRPTTSVKGQYDKDYAGVSGQHPQHFVIYSPEFNFEFPGFPDVRTGDILRLENYMEDSESIANDGEGQLETSNFHYFNYFYKESSSSVAPTAEFDLQTVKCLMVEVGATRNIPNTASAYINAGMTSAASTISPGVERQCYGAKGLFIATVDLLPFGTTFDAFAYAKPIVSLVRKKSNLYGGSTAAAKAVNQYQVTGHFQPFDSTFMTYLAGNAGIADDVEVFGGDAFLGLFDVARMLKDNDPGASDPGISFGMAFPVESKINLGLREGRHIARYRSYELGVTGHDDANAVSFATPSQLEKYTYNPAFSNDGDVILYSHAPENYSPQTREPAHVRFTTPPKTPGEAIDSFLNFLPANYRVVELPAGEINNLRAKMQRLYYWQDSAVGTIAVNERVQVATDIGAALTLGSGQTAERHDERSRFYGNKHQWSLLETEDGFGWYNIDHDAIVHMTVGMKLEEVNMVKGIDSYLRTVATGNLRKTDNPVGHSGIVGCYESKYKRMMFSFKNGTTDRVLLVNIGGELIIGGYFTKAGGLMIDFNEDMYLTANEDLSTIQPSTDYFPNDLLEEGDGIYINILGYTTGLTPTDPSGDPTHWTLIRNKSDVYVNVNTDLCKFFEIVVESQLDFVVNHNQSLEKIFDNFVWNCTEVFFKSLTATTRNQSGTDADIPDNDDYGYYNNAWYSNVPLDTSEDNGQMQDNEMTVSCIQNNIAGPLVTSANNDLLVLVSVKTDYRKAY